MTLLDTLDGAFMYLRTAGRPEPLRKFFYNFTMTALSIAVALVIGTIELLQVLVRYCCTSRVRRLRFIAGLDFGVLGYVIVAMFLLAWGLSVAVWRVRADRGPAGRRRLEPGHREPASRSA